LIVGMIHRANHAKPPARKAAAEYHHPAGKRQRRLSCGHVERHSEEGWVEMKYRYPYVIETTETGYGAYFPDLPGYAATAETVEELREAVREGVPFHIEGLLIYGQPIPEPHEIECVDIEPEKLARGLSVPTSD
jgi:predicted RNase H-like HicB family nuclease